MTKHRLNRFHLPMADYYLIKYKLADTEARLNFKEKAKLLNKGESPTGAVAVRCGFLDALRALQESHYQKLNQIK